MNISAVTISMTISTYGHSCLLVRTGSTAVLLDPGVFSSDILPVLAEELRGARLDAVLITHGHPDHVDPGTVAGVTGSGTTVHAEAGAAEVLRDAGLDAEVVSAGDVLEVGDLSVEVVGGEHAVIHEDVPRVGNVGFLLRAGGVTVFHPGDSYATVPEGVDVLAAPLNAPWATVADTVEFVRAVAPTTVVPVHDGLLLPERREIYLGHVRRLGRADVHDLTTDGPLAL